MDYIPPSQYIDPREHKAQDVQDFLNKIAFLESSSGQNTNHPVMQSGPHIGTHAVGNYGLMPLTAQDIDRSSGINQLQDMDKWDAQNKLEANPDLQRRLVETMASNLLQKNPSDVAAYKWEQGQYSHPTPDDLGNSQRIKRFRALQNVR
jgi:hypothetical protein